MQELDLNGRIALVTGAARGIGLETARALAARGAKVAIVDLDPASCEAAAASLGPSAKGFPADVTDEGAVGEAVAAVVEEFGGIDVVVANAGIAQTIRPVSVVDHADFDRVLAVNLHGVVYTVRQALPHVIERKGHVLVIASVYAFFNGVLQSSYAMSKAAVEQFGRALRVELAPHGVSAGVGYFGFVDTEMVRNAERDPVTQQVESRAPKVLQKRITPGQAGEALVQGIENRAARTIRPRRWELLFRLRGLIAPRFDELMRGDPALISALRAAEQAGSAEGDRGREPEPART